MLSLAVDDAPVANTPPNASPEKEKKATVSCFDHDSDEYVEELEPLDLSDDSRTKRKPRRSRSKGGPDHQWETRTSTSTPDHKWDADTSTPDHQWDANHADNNNSSSSSSKDDNDLPASSRSSPTKEKTSRRSKFKRSMSVDGFPMPEKRHSWDSANRLKNKPDFNWEQFDGEQVESPKTGSQGPPRVRRKPPRRTKSDLTGLDRTNSKVRFCLNENVCFEVDRITKDMKPELFYSKREIKVFKAEKKEEKKEKREKKEMRKEEKERQKEQQAMMENLKAKVADTTSPFAAAPVTSTAIAGAC